MYYSSVMKYNSCNYLIPKNKKFQNTYSIPDNDPTNMLAIDCEMVNTGDEDDLELARVSVVRCCQNADLKSVKGIKQWLSQSKSSAYEVIYDSFVKPENTVVDYLTK